MNLTRKLALFASAGLAACGSGHLHLDLNSDDSASALAAGSVEQPLSAATDLTGVAHVNVVVTEVDVHLADEKAKDDVVSTDVKDNDGGWHVVTTDPQPFDLMTIRADATKPLGDIDLPAGKITAWPSTRGCGTALFCAGSLQAVSTAAGSATHIVISSRFISLRAFPRWSGWRARRRAPWRGRCARQALPGAPHAVCGANRAPRAPR